MDWLDHDRLGFNYRLSRHRLRARAGPARAARRAARRSRAGRRCIYREALGRRIDGLTLPCENTGRAGAVGSCYVIQLPRGVDRDDVDPGARATLGIPAKPYFPAIHLMTYYRETFGYRPGEFPVCEDVAARSIAIPFFPQMTEGQVARVAGGARLPASVARWHPAERDSRPVAHRAA